MNYYVKDNKLYATDTAVNDDSFVEISEDEYNNRLYNAVSNREKGVVSAASGDFTEL